MYDKTIRGNRMILDEEQAKKDIETVSKFADKNQRLAWKRKMNRMETLVERLQPFEEKILKLILEKQPIMDEIDEIRRAMILECVHPADYLVHKGTHIECKFCKNKIRLNKHDRED